MPIFHLDKNQGLSLVGQHFSVFVFSEQGTKQKPAPTAATRRYSRKCKLSTLFSFSSSCNKFYEQ